ncbi:helix-turn-helix domain-containing protein [Pseudomonas sp. MAHUQ-62]|uniref:helix-turn-helix domain-containing protein n=1 Tax=Pseudomonas sp. GCM10023245 TaxID=3252652 RepID=UPI003620DB9E
MRVAGFAEVVHLSPRQFNREFSVETGQSPAKAVEHLRVEVARMQLEDSRHPVDVIAREVDFAGTSRNGELIQ